MAELLDSRAEEVYSVHDEERNKKTTIAYHPILIGNDATQSSKLVCT